MNPFRHRIDRGEVSTVEELKAWYRAEVKRLHPDLQGQGGPNVDFDRLKQHYHEAYRHLLQRVDRAAVPAGPAPTGLASQDAFLDEFRNLVARGFPVNVQAAAKNRAYAASIRLVSGWLSDWSGDPEFFARANAETRALKRTDPTTHWYVLQIYWNIGDFRVTGFDYYRRIFLRHLAFIRTSLEEAGYSTLLALLDSLTGAGESFSPSSTPARSRSPRSET